MSKTGYVYILCSTARTLYVGVTKDLQRRVFEHKQQSVPGFTKRYNVDRLVYYEAFDDMPSAIAREKQIKKWRREKKLALIERVNPVFDDIAADWFEG